eukprot:7580197-Pyramimonas_sp.AAC.1
MVVTRSAYYIQCCCSDRTTFDTSAVKQSSTYCQFSPACNCNLRPWTTMGHDSSPRCRSRVGVRTLARVPAVLQIQ